MRRRCWPGSVLAAAVSLGVLATACVSRQTSTVEVASGDMQAAGDLRTATNLPPQFHIVTPAATPRDCPPELRDPGLRATLRLRRSVLRPSADTTVTGYIAIGDYSVEPTGLYGEEPGEGLRVDCSRLRAIGVVVL